MFKKNMKNCAPPRFPPLFSKQCICACQDRPAHMKRDLQKSCKQKKKNSKSSASNFLHPVLYYVLDFVALHTLLYAYIMPKVAPRRDLKKRVCNAKNSI